MIQSKQKYDPVKTKTQFKRDLVKTNTTYTSPKDSLGMCNTHVYQMFRSRARVFKCLGLRD